jgi:SNF2 family DNA or RNA helicase
MFSHSNTQHQLNSDYQTTLDHNDDEESFPLGQNSSLSHFISSSDRLNEDEEDEPLLLRQRNCQKQINTNKNENDSNSSEESEQQQQQHQERLSDTTDEEEDATEEDDADDSDDDVEEEDDDEDDEDDDEDDDDDDDDDFDDKKRSRTKSKRGFGQAKAKSKKQVKRAKTIPNNSSTTSNRKRQRTSSSTNYASASKKARRQQSSGSGNSSISANKRKIRRTAASNPINYHEESDDDINDQARRKMKKQQRHLSSNSDSDDEQNANTNNDDESNSNDYHSQTITDLELNTAKRQTKVRTSDNLSSSGEGVTIVTDEPSSEIIEKVLKVRFGRKDATGPSTTIYNIDEFGDPNANYNGDDETQSDGEEQFLIKWKNWSHLHNTWESRSSLQQAHVKSSRILENFLKQHEQTRLWRRENLNMDEIELFECQQELSDTALAGYQIVERIVAHEKNREQENTYDYLCKWDGLQYSDCTWEDGNLIAKRFQIRIDEYNARLTQQAEDLQLQQQQQKQQQQTSSGRKKMVITRPRFVPITVQPLYLAPEEPEFKLRDYQLEGLNWLAHSWCKQNSVILADEMGLGKTIQTISFLSYVFEEHCVHGPFLIVVPLSTVQGWQQEFRRWAPHMNTVIYIGDMISREKIRHFEMYASGNKKQLKFHALLTTYDFLLKDSKYLSSINWNVVLVDEAHRLKNDDSMLYRTLIQFESQHRILITGTPLQNSLKELWSLLHFIMPNYFDDWNHFDSKYSSLLTSHDTSLVKRSSELHKELEPFLLRRVKRDVEKSLPAKVEQILRVEMTRIQKQYYKWILTRNYRALTNERGGNLPSFINIMMELKKCANHAFFVKRDDENNTTLDEIIKGSGKLLLLDKLLLKLRASNHRVLIFSQMVKMLNILAEYCKLRRFPFQRLDGSMKGEIRRQALNSFNREASEDFIFLLSTRAGGLGINLATADTVIIYDSDWNPQNDLQAQARAHRIGQTKQVNIYRLVAKQSVEETIIERAKQKMVLDHLVIQRMDTTGRNAFQNLNNTSTSASSSTTDNRPLTKEELNTIIKFGAEDLFKENSTNEESSAEEESQKIDIDEILRRAETRQDDDSSLRNNSEDLLSQFKIANIQTMEDDIIEPTTIVNKSKSWKDIIPESERQKFDDECLAELTAALPPRSRKRVELFNSTSETDNNNNTNRRSLNEFTANEIRRFVKSFKKFSDPIHRLDLVTIDAELEDKSRQDIEELAKHLYNECLLAVEQHTNELSPTTNSQSPKDEQQTNSREKIPTIRLQSVSINALQLINSIRDLEALKKLFTSTNEQRKTFSFPSSIKIKPVHWSCSWSFEDDKALLRGIYEYGYSNWEQIKMEPELGLSSKILLDDKQLKPQANHLQTRADYLLRLLKQYYANPSNKKKDVAKKKKTPVAPITTKKTKITAEENLNGSNSFKKQRRTNGPTVNNHEKQPKSKEIIENSSGDEETSTNKSIKKKSIDHRTHTHTEDKINKPPKKDEENASNDMFKQCKELLRPVKKWFSKLDAPEEAFDSHDDYTKEFEKCLLKIGDQIEYVLKTKKDDDYHTYRYHLWTFVSKFTTKLTDSQLKKYYRTFTKKRDEDTNLISNHSSQKSSSSHSQQSQQQ